MITDIVIVSYKDEVEIKKCIASIQKYCTDYNLIVEDNNIPGQNRGFSKAVNDGIQKGSGEFIWLLNSDAVVKDSMTQQALINRFSYGEQVGIVSSAQVDPDDHDLLRCCGVLQCFPGGVHKHGWISMGHGQIPEKQIWANFASVMLSKKMVEKIGLLDESMYLLYSDSSYSFTARLNSYEVWYEPRSIVYHKLKVSKIVTEWHKKDMEAFMKKWGIIQTPDGKFIYSDLFARLDMFP